MTNKKAWWINFGFVICLIIIMQIFFGPLANGILLWLGFGLALGLILAIRDFMMGYWGPDERSTIWDSEEDDQ